MDMQHSLSYDIDLSGEPSGISAYMVLPADTTQESQNLGLMVERLCSECAIAARVRQYYGGNREDFYDLLDWTSLSVNVDNELTISVDKPAVQAGGKTILELKMTSSNSLPFVSGAKVAITNPWTIQTLLVPQNHVATICDGGDDYRFGFNGMEKDNEPKGLGNSLDFGARLYDSKIGKFLSNDPHATSFVSQSPFSFAFNCPMYMMDNNGKDAVSYIGKDGKLYIHATYFAVTKGVMAYSDVEIKMLQAIYDNFWAQAKGMQVTLPSGEKIEIGGVKIVVESSGAFNLAKSKASGLIDGNLLLKETTEGIQKIRKDNGAKDGGEGVMAITTSENSLNGTKSTTYLNKDKLDQFSVGQALKDLHNSIIDESGHILGTDHPNSKKVTGLSKVKYEKYLSGFGDLEKGKQSYGEVQLSDKDLENAANSMEMQSREEKDVDNGINMGR